ncbi:VOC family protein [Nannocystis sp. SCPEA4]|uniref:VOC family protein n=1 Tax=Nannocystis sp. SCPEA4 TaxID=2996787 RepID=UPI00227135F7|nr:VOC family protein [Nannocystis sp. SCPEA4]MCY1056362.1 VOC family protein [Nannocystis sp. SCPEA4]
MTKTHPTVLFIALTLLPLACSSSPKTDTATPEPMASAPPAPAPEPPKPEVKPIPEGFFAVTPQIVVKGVDEAVDFYVKNLGASKVLAIPGEGGKSIHAEVKIGDSILMIDEEGNDMKSPLTLGGSPTALLIYSPDVDATVTALAAAGGKVTMPAEDQFWGDRWAEVTDPFGHRWEIATHVEDLTPEQMAERAKIALAPSKKKPKKGAAPAWKKIAGTPATEKVAKAYHTITPSFVVADANAAIEFYKNAFGATEKSRMLSLDGKKVMHAEIVIGDSTLMLSDAFPEMGSKSIADYKGTPMSFHHYVTDADAVFAKATAAGATALMPVGDMFWGDRYGMVADPSGMAWGIATHKEDVTPEQMAERMKAEMAKQKPTS